MDDPIFVRGLSRSGGTLMVTMLDAHPDVAMSYELYPALIEATTDEFPPIELAQRLQRASPRTHVRDVAATRGWQTFLARSFRGGLTLPDVGYLLHRHLSDGRNFNSVRERLQFIEACCLAKMRRCRKRIWGLKCTSHYEDYLDLWPSARFINMVRDGRDVLASQMNTGSFNHDPTALATAWINTHRRFQALQADIGMRALAISYENLVQDPVHEVSCMLLKLGLSDAPVVNFYKQDLTIFSASHLSLKEISEPINGSSVGRWKRDLTTAQVDEFEVVAGTLLEELGYLRARC